MAVAYETFTDDIEARSVDSSDSQSVDSMPPGTSTGLQAGSNMPPRLRRMHYLMTSRWPYHTGTAHIALGLFLSFMGLAEIITLPMIYNDNFAFVTLNKHNHYGLPVWLSFVVIACGMVGLGAAFRKSIHQMYAYFVVVLFELAAITAVLLFILDAYTARCCDLAAFHQEKLPFAWHIVTCLAIVPIYIVGIATFTQYYEDVCFGELQCCKSVVHCLCPCVCPRAVDRAELLEETTERPPSLPV